jgi:hypothetical protein
VKMAVSVGEERRMSGMAKKVNHGIMAENQV